MRKPLLQLFIVCGIVLFCGSTSAHAATVRGLVVHANGAPAVSYNVTTYNQKIGRSAPTVVQPNGLYVLINIPAGVYYLEVWAPGATQPFVYQVFIAEPLADLPVARVP
jgi:hypothetical protein